MVSHTITSCIATLMAQILYYYCCYIMVHCGSLCIRKTSCTDKAVMTMGWYAKDHVMSCTIHLQTFECACGMVLQSADDTQQSLRFVLCIKFCLIEHVPLGSATAYEEYNSHNVSHV